MSDDLPPLPTPTLEDDEYELWGQNVRADFYTKAQLVAYARAAELRRLHAAHEHQYEMAGLMLREAERTQRELDKLREAARMALENLDGISDWLQNTGNDHLCDEYAATLAAIDALRAALGDKDE